MNIGFAVCGSFCTFRQMFPAMEALATLYNVVPIFSFAASATDTRFGSAADHLKRAEQICGRAPILSIRDAEPIGPKKLLDALVIAPCTGNTLAKLACGIADTPVTMAAKSHLRNGRPVLIAVSTNDALGAAAGNIGTLMARKHYFFVPMRQDDPAEKPTSMVAEFRLIPQALESALIGRQLQPILPA